jgi:hypothetical protein
LNEPEQYGCSPGNAAAILSRELRKVFLYALISQTSFNLAGEMRAVARGTMIWVRNISYLDGDLAGRWVAESGEKLNRFRFKYISSTYPAFPQCEELFALGIRDVSPEIVQAKRRQKEKERSS